MREGITIAVSEANRARLEAIVGDRNSPQKHVWRAQIVLLSRRTNPRLAQSKPPFTKGFRGLDRQRQSLSLHRFRATAGHEIRLLIIQPTRLRFGH
jgi:hypothetical protein